MVDLLNAYIPSSTTSYFSRRLYDAMQSSVRGVLWGSTKVQYFATGTQLAPQFGILALHISAKSGCIHIKKWIYLMVRTLFPHLGKRNKYAAANASC